MLGEQIHEFQAQRSFPAVHPGGHADTVVGHEAAKTRLREDAALLKRGSLDSMPMGYLICGPVGTGKSFLAQCVSGEIGAPCVMLKNFRSKYVGETEGNLERVLSVLRAMGPVVVVVDEAFMDAVPGEAESVISDDLTGLLVFRSLTKTWGLAGLRAGYVIGEPKLIAAMRRQQPPWSVSTPALAAVVACMRPQARSLAAAAAEQIANRRAYLVERLADVGLKVAGLPQGPYVLVDTSGVAGDREPGWVRLALRDHGFAVRRGETFPGLGPDWMRIAVREPEMTDQLVAALRRLVRL